MPPSFLFRVVGGQSVAQSPALDPVYPEAKREHGHGGRKQSPAPSTGPSAAFDRHHMQAVDPVKIISFTGIER
jgi:hypothetical protein